MFNYIFRISCFHFAKHVEKQCCWHGRSSKKILTRAYKDYGTLKRNFMPWLRVMKIVCVFYLVSLHISFPLTPTPFIIYRDVTGVWVDNKIYNYSGGEQRESMDLPGEEALGHPVYTPSFY